MGLWWRGVRAAWSAAPARRSRADSIAAGVIFRRQISGLFLLALVAMGAAVSVVSCQSTPDLSGTALGPIFGSDRGERVVVGGREPDIRVRIKTRVPGINLAGPRTLSFRPVGMSTPVLIQTPVAVSISPRGLVTRDPSGSTREWGPGVDLDVQAVGEPPDRSNLFVDGTAYPGTLALRGKWRESGLAFDVISALPMETYLAGVLQKELYDGWPRQAYEAQAIAARSYAIHERARARTSNRAHDVESTTLDQAYGGLPTRAVAIDAARTTRGMVLTYDGPGGGGVLRAYYSSCCGGRPATAAAIWPTRHGFEFNLAPALQGSSRPWACERAPVFAWEVVRLNDELVRRIKAWGRSVGKRLATLERLRTIDTIERNAAGKPNVYQITDVRGQTFRLSAEEMRLACNEGDASVPSAILEDIRSGPAHVRSGDLEFTIVPPAPGGAGGGTVRIKGRGFGHGVGLCQYCAKGFAERGQDAATMLRTFYPGASVSKSY
jgi:stage II sporulation protein D